VWHIVLHFYAIILQKVQVTQNITLIQKYNLYSCENIYFILFRYLFIRTPPKIFSAVEITYIQTNISYAEQLMRISRKYLISFNTGG